MCNYLILKINANKYIDKNRVAKKEKQGMRIGKIVFFFFP
jgi:hypothetical protein